MNDESPESSDAFSPARSADVDAEGGAPARAAGRVALDTYLPSQFDANTAGGMIRSARQAQGIALASLAAMLKIPLRRLEALEGGRHDELQGPTFERALAQAACRVLKIDPKPVLALLPQHERNTLEGVTEGINTPFRDGQASRVFELPGLMRPVVVIVVLLVVAAIALFAMPESWVAHVTRPFTGLPAEAPPASAASAVAAVVVPVAPQPASAASSPAAVAASAAEPASAASVAALSPATVSATAAQGIDEVLAHVAAAPNIPLQVIATSDTWVEVVDAQGHSLLSRTVVAGESVGLDGALPMRVKIGNAKGTRLKLRGDNVDLTPWTRDNVARLELK